MTEPKPLVPFTRMSSLPLFLFIVSLVVLKTLRFLNWHVSLVLMNILTLPHPAGRTPVMLDRYSVIAPDRDPVWLEFSRFPRTETFNQDATVTPDSGRCRCHLLLSHSPALARHILHNRRPPPSCVTSFRPPVCAVSLSSTTPSRTLKRMWGTCAWCLAVKRAGGRQWGEMVRFRMLPAVPLAIILVILGFSLAGLMLPARRPRLWGTIPWSRRRIPRETLWLLTLCTLFVRAR